MKWYTTHFNIVPSDILYVPMGSTTDGKPDRKEVALFAHIDRGQGLVDHVRQYLISVIPIPVLLTPQACTYLPTYVPFQY